MKNSSKTGNETDGYGSDTTIYNNILNKMPQREDEIQVDAEITFNRSKFRESSSSEDQIDTSDDLMETDVNDKFIAECAAEVEKGRSRKRSNTGEVQETNDIRPTRPNCGEEMICEAEASRARIFRTPGNEFTNPPARGSLGFNQEDSLPYVQQYLTVVDENYLVTGSHLDRSIGNKIVNNEYVDFSRLIPRERMFREEDHRMELISKGWQTYFVPVSDREATGISSFSKWEEAFRIFSNVYTSKFPSKATELIQCNYVIYTASLTFAWDNVYQYDKEFRMHISNYLQRS